jgi:DNA (cytosine-5)-methyltransferase 1
MKVLNLYAGLGGNRKLWEDVEVTAVEYDPEIAAIYKEYFPQDEVITGDAHEYLLKNYKRFDAVWTSPPCPTHSRPRMWASKGGRYDVMYPDMTLYQEIIFLQHYFDGIYWAENVIPFYEPLIKPTITLGRHLIWTNCNTWKWRFNGEHTQVWSTTSSTENYGFSVKDRNIKHRKDQLIRNLVNPEIGLYLLNCARNIKPEPEQIGLFSKQ